MFPEPATAMSPLEGQGSPGREIPKGSKQRIETAAAPKRQMAPVLEDRSRFDRCVVCGLGGDGRGFLTNRWCGRAAFTGAWQLDRCRLVAKLACEQAIQRERARSESQDDDTCQQEEEGIGRGEFVRFGEDVFYRLEI